MGCDIHAYVEIKINGQWELYNHPRIERNYILFARMANVRNYAEACVEPIAEPRGLPIDISKMTRFCRDADGIDGHSDSWLSGEEVEALCEWFNNDTKDRLKKEWYSFEHEQIGYIFGSDWDVQKHQQYYPKGVEDARLVFWFDN